MTTTRSLLCEAVTAGWISWKRQRAKSLRLIASSVLRLAGAERARGRSGGRRSRCLRAAADRRASARVSESAWQTTRVCPRLVGSSAEASERAVGTSAAGARADRAVRRRVRPVRGGARYGRRDGRRAKRADRPRPPEPEPERPVCRIPWSRDTPASPGAQLDMRRPAFARSSRKLGGWCRGPVPGPGAAALSRSRATSRVPRTMAPTSSRSSTSRRGRPDDVGAQPDEERPHER